MTIPTATLVKLGTLSLSAEDAAVVAAMLGEVEAATRADAEAVIEASRTKARNRVARWRENHPRNVTERNTTSRNGLRASDAPVEDNFLPQKIEKKESKVTPRSELEAVLDADHAGAVIEHRQRLRKPLTARAAKMLAGEFRQFPDPNAAADRMILKGWQSIEAGWGKPEARGSPSRRENLSDTIDRKFNGHDSKPDDPEPSKALVLDVPASAIRRH